MNHTRKPENKLKVISASRRIDMVGCFPDQFVKLLTEKCDPQTVHTLVIWTKNPHNLFAHSLLVKKVTEYRQVYIHYTITGMGQSSLEPRVPAAKDALKMLPQLIELTGSPLRIRFRFDPIVHFILPTGETYTNLHDFKVFAPYIASLGIQDVSISWISKYKKVVNRLARSGVKIIERSDEEQQQDYEFIKNLADQHRLTIHACSVPNFPRSRCIDGELLNRLHPDGATCSTKKAKGQRTTCGCTESWDIGWYFQCPHGCLYCYANPVSIKS